VAAEGRAVTRGELRVANGRESKETGRHGVY